MNILAFVKEVRDSSVRLAIDEATQSVVQGEPEPLFLMNPPDRSALELALRLRGEAGGMVIAATLSGQNAIEVLCLALAAGADRAIHLSDPGAEGVDTLGKALVLSRLASTISFDLILCGNSSLDTGTAALPAMVAELLGLPQVTGAVGIEVDQSTARVQQRLGRGNRRVVACLLPAVVAVHASIAEPRYVSVWAVRDARERTIERRTLADLGISADDLAVVGGIEIARITTPRARPKKLWTPDASMTARDRLKFLAGGGIQKKSSSGIIEGPPEEVASHIVEYLKAEKLI